VSTALVVNGSRAYNLGAQRLTAWLKGRGEPTQLYERPALPTDLELLAADALYLSALFSWDLPVLVGVAHRAQALGVPELQLGGPAAEHNAAWVQTQTGLTPWRGPHPCERAHLPLPTLTRTSRGCVNRCGFCLVARAEGPLVELPDDRWQPAAKLLDNNFLACSPAHQEHVLARLAAAGLRRLDFNQGLDARRYTPDFRARLAHHGLRLVRWRFAYDTPADWPAVQAALRDLRQAGVNWARVQVFVLYGYAPDDTPAAASARAEQVIGDRTQPLACPWPMAYKPLDWLEEAEYVPAGWTVQAVLDLRRYYSRPTLWRTIPWAEYDRRQPHGRPPAGYPPDWYARARQVKDAAGWRCTACGHVHDPDHGYTLTVHHRDGDPGHNDLDNLVALCQRCHLAAHGRSRQRPGRGQIPLLTVR